jgi:hypothetical protein
VSGAGRRRVDRGEQVTRFDWSSGLRGHFVLRAIGKRLRKDRTAGCEKVVSIRFALDSSLEGEIRPRPLWGQVRSGLTAGGRWIRTCSTALRGRW